MRNAGRLCVTDADGSCCECETVRCAFSQLRHAVVLVLFVRIKFIFELYNTIVHCVIRVYSYFRSFNFTKTCLHISHVHPIFVHIIRIIDFKMNLSFKTVFQPTILEMVMVGIQYTTINQEAYKINWEQNKYNSRISDTEHDVSHTTVTLASSCTKSLSSSPVVPTPKPSSKSTCSTTATAATTTTPSRSSWRGCPKTSHSAMDWWEISFPDLKKT